MEVGVWVGVVVGLDVAVWVEVLVNVEVVVDVGVRVGVFVAVSVAPETVWMFPLKGPPETSAGTCVVVPNPKIEEALIVFKKFPAPAAFKLNTSKKV